MTAKSDARLHSDVAAELLADPAQPVTNAIAVSVRDGAVVLSGVVASYWQKSEAGDTVKRVDGVRSVVNDLRVDFFEVIDREDADIARIAGAALACHSDLPATIGISVAQGWITLTGQVDWQFQKTAAQHALDHVRGVKGFTNAIGITKTAPSAGDLSERIRAGLDRTIDAQANEIAVDVRNGNVSLRGNVQSWVDVDAANRAAWSVPGVSSVDNNLVIR